MTYTPDELRKFADDYDEMRGFAASRTRAHLYASAAAWEAALAVVANYEGDDSPMAQLEYENRALRKRLEEAEAEIDEAWEALDNAGAPQGTDEEVDGMMSEREYSLAERIASLPPSESESA